MKILYFPPPDNTNQYSENMSNILFANTENAIDGNLSFKDLIKRPSLVLPKNKYDVVILNWLENNLRSKKGNLSIVGFFVFFIKLIYFALITNKLVYVRHNLYPHGMKGWQAKIAQQITNIGENICSVKISHSGHLLKHGYSYVPHPLYELSVNSDLKPKIPSYYIIFGRIERYKKIETIIKNWDLEETLLIAGSIANQPYLDELLALSAGKNIKFDARFIPDNEAANLVSASSGVILAHSEENMIVSGSFFFAITLGVPVFAIENPFFNWLRKEKLFKQLHLSSTPETIVTSLKKKQPFDSNAIKMQADKFFGVVSTSASWNQILDNLFNPKKKGSP